MKQKTNIIFDLDGTLIDSQEGITKSVQYALERMDITPANSEELKRFIGPPLKKSFMEYYGFSEEKAKLAITYYRINYNSTGLYQNSLYPGIADLLDSLTRSGKTLAVATTKPQIYAEKILNGLKLNQFFKFIGGSELDGSRSDKAELIRYAMEHSGMDSLAGSVMIGDTRFDIKGAHEVGIDSIGVLYGFGAQSELEAYNPTALVTNTTELAALLLP